jgi:membrane protease YdiL (CAAX protease family)
MNKYITLLYLIIISPFTSLYLQAEEPEDKEMVFNDELSGIATSPIFQQPTLNQNVETIAPPLDTTFHKSTSLAVGLSWLFPGLGHFYLGKPETAGILMGTAAAATAGLTYARSIPPGQWSELDLEIAQTSLFTLETAALYGIYAAYRDARIYNKQFGFSYSMPNDQFKDLAYAPVNIQVLKKPEVWAALAGSVGLAMILERFALGIGKKAIKARSLYGVLSPFKAFPIGISEECLFRGFLQPQLTEWFSPWGGIITSSLLFGLAHIPNAFQYADVNDRNDYYRVAVPFITLSGIYDGWLAMKNCSLKETVALHVWYDFILFAIDAIQTKRSIRESASFMIALPF